MIDPAQQQFERQLEQRVIAAFAGADSAHDTAHIRRVVANARVIAAREGGQMAIVIPAAWLHDLVTVPKSSPDRSRASQLSAEAAIKLLREMKYPEEHLAEISHAIAAHSFSAGLDTKTLEACIVQDADRLDAIGAIGIARCFATTGSMGRSLYNESDPFAVSRPLDDREYAVDHFAQKLLGLAATMKTDAGRALAQERTEFLRVFLAQLARELPPSPAPSPSSPSS